MSRSTLISLLLVLVGGGFLAVRAYHTGMGSVYVQTIETETETLQVKVDPGLRDQDGVEFSWAHTLGVWVAALSTLCIFSFLYGDNVFYKLAEAVFVGVSAGYAMVVGFWSGLIEQLFNNLAPDLMREWAMPGSTNETQWIYIFPLLLGIMLLFRLAPAATWLSRWPLAFFIGVTAGLEMIVYFESDFIQQIRNTIIPLVVMPADGTFHLWTHSLRNVTIVVGVLSCLTYFFFSVEHTGVFGGVSRLGIWFLMITFGAGFGYTVMGRIALLVERLEFLFDDWLWLIDPAARRLGM